MNTQQPTPPLENTSQIDLSTRKRVRNACDRCRLKKLKCDEATPCGRCGADNKICFFGPHVKSRERVYPKGYVEMLEQEQAQLMAGVQELYRLIKNSPNWLGPPLWETSNGKPLISHILERLGVLTQDGPSNFMILEEEHDLTQQQLTVRRRGCMQRQDSSGCESDTRHSPVSQSTPSKSSSISDQSAVDQILSSSANQISDLSASQTPGQVEDQAQIQPTSIQSDRSWARPLFGYGDNMDFLGTYAQIDRQTMPTTDANPCLGMQYWTEDEDFIDFRSTSR